MAMPMVQIEKLSKRYGPVKALEDVHLSVGRGELFGLIGPDGAGKTTLFRILASLLLPDSGYARVNGFDVVNDYKQIRCITGYMPGRFSLYQDLSVEENLQFYASVFGTTISENYYLIKDIYSQIEPFRKRPAGKLSGGMKQKLALSCALIHKPEILILDEPTTGVDAVSRKEFWQMLARLKQEEITILVSTPYMEEAAMCDRVALIQKGNILDIDTPALIASRFSQALYAVRSDQIYRLINDLRAFPLIGTVYAFGQYLHVTASSKVDIMDETRQYMQMKGHREIEIFAIEPGIEDYFMELMTSHEPINR